MGRTRNIITAIVAALLSHAGIVSAQEMDSLFFEFSQDHSYAIANTILERLGKTEEATFTSRSNENLVEAYVYARMSSFLYEHSSYEKAVKLGLDGLECMEQSQDSTLAFGVRSTLCMSYAHNGSYSEGLRYAQMNYEAGIASGDKEQIAASLTDLATICLMMDKVGDAEEYILKAIEMEKETGNRVTLAESCGKASEIYRSLSQPDKALSFAMDAYRIDMEDGRISKAAIRLCQIAGCQSDKGNYDEARNLYISSAEYFITNGEYNSLAVTYYHLGRTAEKRHRTSEALEWYENGAEIARACHSNPTLISLMERLAEVNSSVNPDRAVVLYRELVALKDSIHSKEAEEQYSLMSTAFNIAEKEMTIKKQKETIAQERRKITAFGIGALVLVIILVHTAIFSHKMKKMNRDLEKMNSIKDRFFSIMSHDLRSPIKAQKMALKSLAESSDALSEEDKHLLCVGMYEQTKTLEQFVENTLSWAKVQFRGIADIPKHRFELHSTIGETMTLLRPSFEQKEIILEYDGPDELFMFNDRNMVTRVVGNLLTNSLKFTERGGSVRVRVTRLGKGKVSIQVIDNGIGMPSEQAAQFFDLQNWTQRNGTEKEKGTGLGLIVAHDMAVKCGGSLSAESEIGKGSTFTLVCIGAEDAHEN